LIHGERDALIDDLERLSDLRADQWLIEESISRESTTAWCGSSRQPAA
jgi:hypothetical protein